MGSSFGRFIPSLLGFGRILRRDFGGFPSWIPSLSGFWWISLLDSFSVGILVDFSLGFLLCRTTFFHLICWVSLLGDSFSLSGFGWVSLSVDSFSFLLDSVGSYFVDVVRPVVSEIYGRMQWYVNACVESVV